jgi:RNA polymerase sigma-70 factor (ECF subfamily)
MNLHQLVKEAKQGSAAAQKCLYDAFSGSMLLVCCRYVKDRQDAEELMLNGFYKFFTSLHSFHYQSDAALHGWLKKIMVNECLMFLRKKIGFTLSSDMMAEGPALEEEALNRMEAQQIHKLILELPVGYRTIFNLHAIEGWEHKEIASMLGISEGTSKSQLNKARKLLQKILLQQGIVYEQRKTK